MPDPFKIVYEYRFDSGAVKTFDILLDRGTLTMMAPNPGSLPAWAQLEFNQCVNCPLNKVNHASCPVAANLSDIIESFQQHSSLERVDVTVTIEERTYSKTTPVPHGLSPLLGIIMTTSGCPIMEPLKPMVRYHLPFANLEETVFRMVSMYLVGQFLRAHEGKKGEWSLDGLAKIYEEVTKVNKGFSRRMHAAAESDANVNALVNLDVFAIMVPRVAEDMLQQIKPYFYAHLK